MILKTVRGLGRLFIGLLALMLLVLPASTAQAAAQGSLYSYTLDGSSTSFTNAAAANSNVSLNLLGDWSQTAFGVLFEGNTVNTQSVGYAKPATGNTINVASSQAFGGSVMFKYQAPTSGTCFSDSPNIMQIGKFGTNLTQFKFQLSNCGKNKTAVFPQCRVAGNSGANNPVTGTQSLVDGTTYVLQCVKSPDPVSGSASLQMNLVKIDTVNGNVTNTDNFAINRTGTLSSTQYLSIANQYPLKLQSNNTDQFNGEVSKIAYCSGATQAIAKECLDTEVPVQ